MVNNCDIGIIINVVIAGSNTKYVIAGVVSTIVIIIIIIIIIGIRRIIKSKHRSANLNPLSTCARGVGDHIATDSQPTV